MGEMSKMEAMRLFVRTLEEEVSEWWSPDLMEEEIFKSADMSDGKQEEEEEQDQRWEAHLRRDLRIHVVRRLPVASSLAACHTASAVATSSAISSTSLAPTDSV